MYSEETYVLCLHQLFGPSNCFFSAERAPFLSAVAVPFHLFKVSVLFCVMSWITLVLDALF